MAEKNSNSLMPVRRALIPYEAVEHQRHSDLSYRCVENLVLTGADLFQSLFGGAILRDCRFTSVLFARSDLNGTRVERCTFIDCDLTSCDIRFANFGNTTFVRCRLEGALIHQCSLTDVTFDECSFENGVHDGNVYERCTIRRCHVYRSSNINNKAYACHYQNIAFEQGSLTYWVASDCTFAECSIGIESVGMIYGLSVVALERFAYYFPGEDTPRALGVSVAESLMNEYAMRGWAIGLAMLKINLTFASTAYAFKEYFDFLLRSDTDILHPPREELSFVVDVFDELARKQRLPLLCCGDALRYFTVARRVMSPSSQAMLQESSFLGLLVTRIEMLTAGLLNALEQSLTSLERSMDGSPILLELRFETKPEVDVVELLRQATAASNLGCDFEPRVLDSRPGSHIELLAVCCSSLVALRLVLMAANGCVVELVKLRVNTTLLTSTDLNIPRGRRPAAARYLTRARSAVDGVVKFVGSLRWLSDPRLKGWDSENLQRVSASRLPPVKRKRSKVKTVAPRRNRKP